MDLQAGVIFVLIILGFIGIVAYRYYRDKKRDQPVQEKINAYRKVGQALKQEHDVPLTEAEAKRIRSQQSWFTWFIAFVLLLILFGVACAIVLALDVDVYIVAPLSLVLAGAMVYAFYRYFVKIRSRVSGGNKTIVRGFITNKYEDGDESTSYHLEIDTLEFQVGKSVYKKYQLGDAVEFHIFKPYSNMILYEAKLEGAGLRDTNGIS